MNRKFKMDARGAQKFVSYRILSSQLKIAARSDVTPVDHLVDKRSKLTERAMPNV
jgi:hypothetical protein